MTMCTSIYDIYNSNRHKHMLKNVRRTLNIHYFVISVFKSEGS